MDRARHSAFIRLLNWLGGHELAVLLGFASLMAGVLGFVILADRIHAGTMQSVDRSLLLVMRRPPDNAPIGSPAFQEAVRDITSLGGAVVLGFVTAAVAGFLVLDGKRRMAMLVLASACGGLLMNVMLKDTFHRPRPQIVPHLAYASGESFPSGHSMLSATIYLTLGALLARSHQRKRLKAYFLLLATLLTLMIGVSRVYLGVHWPTDVLAGWTAGAWWALLCWLIARSLQSRRTVELETDHADTRRPPISIRKADTGDARAILACLQEAFAGYRDFYTPGAFRDTVLTAEDLETRLATMEVFVATSPSGEIAGTIACQTVSPEEGHLRGMAVRPDWHGTGLANKLLLAVESELLGRGCLRITLDTTLPLKRAMRFYETHGFQRSGRVTDFFGMVLIEYVKTLST